MLEWIRIRHVCGAAAKVRATETCGSGGHIGIERQAGNLVVSDGYAAVSAVLPLLSEEEWLSNIDCGASN